MITRIIMRRGIYLFPNLLTTVSLVAGFYAIVAAMIGLFDHAAIAIYVAIVADGLDGRFARLTDTESSFGSQYDSLSDMVAFGVAPSLIAYSLALHILHKLGWLIAFCYTVATALRLARFNTKTNHSAYYFIGLPCPAAAGLLASFIWITHVLCLAKSFKVCIIAIITFVVGLLMVSNIPYFSFKNMDFKGHVSFIAMLLIIGIVIAIAFNPPYVLFILFFLYTLSGIILWLRRKIRKIRRY